MCRHDMTFEDIPCEGFLVCILFSVLSELLELSRICLKRLPMINGSLKYCDYHNIKTLLWLYAFNHKWKSLNDCRLKTDKQILTFFAGLVWKCLKTEGWTTRAGKPYWMTVNYLSEPGWSSRATIQSQSVS